jgi:YNFM family putative membrane transporter
MTASEEKAQDTRIASGSSGFWRANIALSLSAFAVFALLYSVQPLLPLFTQEFDVEPGTSSLSLSVTTAVLAVAMLLSSRVADRIGRKTLMIASLCCSSFLGLLTAVAPDWGTLLAARMAMGLALSGVPAIAMTYLAEEMSPKGFGVSMGLYIGGNALGGMSGRLLVGLVADYTSWRLALGFLATLCLFCTILFIWLLPPPRHSARHQKGHAPLASVISGHMKDAGLPLLFAEAFLLMGAFVTLYNYAGFRLSEPPYSLSHAAISMIFAVYLVGMGSSTWIGNLANSLGRGRVLWVMVVVMGAGLALTCVTNVPTIILGLAVATFGFFGAHSVASSWVGRRASTGRAQASALYLFFYYLGSSVLGTAGGYAWSWAGWGGVAGMGGAALLAALLISLKLAVLKPLPVINKP